MVFVFSVGTVMSPKYSNHVSIVCVFVAESVLLVYDFGNIFERVLAPAVSDGAITLLDGMLMYVRYFKQNEHFDLLTHGMGPRLMSVVIYNFSQFMEDLIGQKLDHTTTYCAKCLFPKMYMDKLRSIVNSIVVEKTVEYTRKVCKAQQEKVPLAPKKKRKKKQQNQEKVQPDEDSASEDIEVLSNGSCSSNENDFTT